MDFGLSDFLPLVVTWAEAQVAEAASKGRPLDEDGLALARRMGVEHPERVRIWMRDELPTPEHPVLVKLNEVVRLISPHMAGLTLGHTIIIRNGCTSSLLLAHEFRHVHQYEKEGSIAAFLGTYLRQILAVGYSDAPYEKDANEHARQAH